MSVHDVPPSQGLFHAAHRQLQISCAARAAGLQRSLPHNASSSRMCCAGLPSQRRHQVHAWPLVTPVEASHVRSGGDMRMMPSPRTNRYGMTRLLVCEHALRNQPAEMVNRFSAAHLICLILACRLHNAPEKEKQSDVTTPHTDTRCKHHVDGSSVAHAAAPPQAMALSVVNMPSAID